MKITIENTTKIVQLKNNVPARVWEGETDSGIKVYCFITRITVSDNEQNLEQFKKELMQQKAPSEEMKSIPLRLVL